MMNAKKYCKAGSLKYKEAGMRARLALDRLRDTDFPPVAWKVTLAVIELTATYSKAWDETYVAAVAERAKCSRQVASTWLPRLADAEIIQWKPSYWNGAPSLVGLPGLPEKPEEDINLSPPDDMSNGSPVTARRKDGHHAVTLPRSNPEESALGADSSEDTDGPCSFCGDPSIKCYTSSDGCSVYRERILEKRNR